MNRTLRPVTMILALLLSGFSALAESQHATPAAQRATVSAPEAPMNLRLDPAAPPTSWGADLIWDAPGNVTILVYQGSVQVGSVIPQQFANLGRWWFPVSGLQPSTAYTFRVQAQSTSGTLSPLSNPLTFTTLPGENPVAGNLRLDPTYPQTPFSVRLTWDAPETSDVLIYRGTSTTPEAVVGYLDQFEPPWRYTLDDPSRSQDGRDLRLKQNTIYSFRVQAQSIADNSRGPISQPFTFRTLPTNDHTPPTTPSNLVFACDAYSIYARWTGSSDNYDPQTEITYEFYDVDRGNLVILLKGVTQVQVTNGGRFFAAGRKYFIIARDRSDNGSRASDSGFVPTAGCTL